MYISWYTHLTQWLPGIFRAATTGRGDGARAVQLDGRFRKPRPLLPLPSRQLPLPGLVALPLEQFQQISQPVPGRAPQQQQQMQKQQRQQSPQKWSMKLPAKFTTWNFELFRMSLRFCHLPKGTSPTRTFVSRSPAPSYPEPGQSRTENEPSPSISFFF